MKPNSITKNNYLKFLFIPCSVGLLLLLTSQSFGQGHPGSGRPQDAPDSPWASFVRGGYVYQFESDIEDNNGGFAAHRLFIQPGVTYAPDRTKSFTLAVGFGLDDYDFSGDTGFGAQRPWDDIYSLRFSTPIRYARGQNWSFFVVPTLRFTGESGVDIGDSLTGGIFAGFAYRFSDRLSIGPGLGVISQLEDDASVFPVLLINWKITDTISLETGRGLGATLGPGIALHWQVSEQWRVSLGGRYEKLRFRLEDTALAPNGIGQDESFPIYLGATYSFSPSVRLSLIGGYETSGELQLEDQNGNVLENHDYEGVPFIGFSFSYRF